MRKGLDSGHDHSAPGNGGASQGVAPRDLDAVIGRSATVEEEQFLREFELQIARSIAADRADELTPAPQQRAFPPEAVRPPKPKSGGNGEAKSPSGIYRANAGSGEVPRSAASQQAPRPASAAPSAQPPQRTVASEAPPGVSDPQETAGLPATGAILELATGQIVIYDRHIPEQQIQMVLLLRPDGSVKTEVLNLRLGCKYREIGALPPKDVVAMQVAQVWHRAQVLFHLTNFGDSRLVPVPATQAAPEPQVKREATRGAEWPDEETPSLPKVKWSEPGSGPAGMTLHRGQRIRITMSPNRFWDAVYWGNNGAEAVVAHQTHGDWAVTYVNLSRFGADAVTVEGMMTDREIWELEEILKRTYL